MSVRKTHYIVEGLRKLSVRIDRLIGRKKAERTYPIYPTNYAHQDEPIAEKSAPDKTTRKSIRAGDNATVNEPAAKRQVKKSRPKKKTVEKKTARKKVAEKKTSAKTSTASKKAKPNKPTTGDVAAKKAKKAGGKQNTKKKSAVKKKAAAKDQPPKKAGKQQKKRKAK